MKRRTQSSFVFFDVTYVDGSRSSNRKVPSSLLEATDGVAAAVEAAIETQDRKIGFGIGSSSGRHQVADPFADVTCGQVRCVAGGVPRAAIRSKPTHSGRGENRG